LAQETVIGISVITSEKANTNGIKVVEALKSKGSKNVYFHIDVDVIDPSESTYQPVTAEGGLTTDAFSNLLKEIYKEFNIVGVSVLLSLLMVQRLSQKVNY